jgi:ribose-phosphate pyrophosphokinase
LVDALRRTAGGEIEINLICPYLPYARQDRVCASGESLALKVMCDIMNGLKFAAVTVWDVHSDVSLALLNNVYNTHQRVFVGRINWKNTVLVAPDAGAIKKTMETAKALGLPMVRADKIRSVEDGSITGTTVYSEHIGDKDFLMVDDIGDGLRTFLELSKELRKKTNGKIYLYVTHLIASKGLDVCTGLIDGIYTANPWPTVDLNHPLLTVI